MSNKFVAKSMTKFFRFTADMFFRERYGHRAVVLETVAGVPGMVAGMLTHLSSLRGLKKGQSNKIHEMLAEAENERKHLMFIIEVVQPTKLERGLIVVAQWIFWHYYLVMYMAAPKTAHLMIHYFEEEAVKSYSSYLEEIFAGRIQDVPAPQIAIDYYNMLPDAMLSDMIKYIRQDEQKHADLNLFYSEDI